MATWTTPTNFAAEEIVTSTKLNEQVIQDLLYLYEGIGQWTEFTPTWSGFTVGNGATFGRYRRVKDAVDFHAGFKLGSTSSVTSTLSLTGPLTTASAPTGFTRLAVGVCVALDSSTSLRYAGAFFTNQSTTVWADRLVSDGVVGWTATTPFTWAEGDECYISGSIPVA